MLTMEKTADYVKRCVQIELNSDEGYIDIVEKGFDACVRMER
jgi:hypothetical protein